MSKAVTLDAEALQELEEAAAFYDKQEPGLGIDLFGAASAVVAQVQSGPSQYVLMPGVPRELGVRRALLRRFPYALIFVELDKEIRILAFTHGKRRPGYWRNRVP